MKDMQERTKLAARKAIDTALAGCGTDKEQDALLFGVRLAIEVLKGTEKTIDQLIAEQGVRPIMDLKALCGALPDEDVDEMVFSTRVGGESKAHNPGFFCLDCLTVLGLIHKGTRKDSS